MHKQAGFLTDNPVDILLMSHKTIFIHIQIGMAIFYGSTGSGKSETLVGCNHNN